MLKKVLTVFMATTMLLTAMPIYIMAEPLSGSSISYYDDDDNDYSRYDDDDDDDYTSPSNNNNTPNDTFAYAETTTEITTAAMITDSSGITTPDGIVANFNIQAEAAALIDAKTGIMLYGKNVDKKMYPASITKVMTTLIACEKGNLDDMVTVSSTAVNSIPWDSSKANLVEGEVISLRDLLYSVILVSGNDAALAVAEHIAGSEEAFVKMMNDKARELGCQNTNFSNPHGYHDDNHYTTAADMALIARAASQNDEVNKIWGSSDRSIPASNLHESRVLNHSDKMLQPTTAFYDERVKGGKTGFHNQAFNTLVTYGVNGDVELIAVVMKDNGYDPTYTDTKTLFDFGFGLYTERKLYGRDQFERILPVIQVYNNENIDLGAVNVTLAKDLTAYTPSFINSDSVSIICDLPEQLTAPIAVDDVLGKITVKYGDIELGTVDIVPVNAVEAIPEKELARQHRQKVFIKTLKIIGIVIFALILLFIAVVFGLRAWFKSQRKRQNRRNNRRKEPLVSTAQQQQKQSQKQQQQPKTKSKKKKIKIKFK